MPWHNNRALLKDIDKLPHGPDWEVQPFKLTGSCGEEIVELWKRNPLDVIRALLLDRKLQKYLHYVPQRHYTSRDCRNRRRGELWTGDWLWKVQQLIEDEFATIISCIVSSDETKLTNFAGNKKAHPVYLTIGNLPKRLRRRISKRTSVLIGYLPVPTLSCEPNKEKAREMKRELFHQCLGSILAPLANACKSGGVEVPCSDGGIRRIYPVLASYVADFPEQCKVACTKQTHCPLCMSHPKTRGDPGISAVRDRDDTLETIREAREGPSARFNWLGLTQSGDPFWAEHEYVDLGSFLTPDLLHQMHKGVMKDHLIKWVTTILGKSVLDERYISMPECRGMRHFKHGISSVSQWTGRELKEMTKILLPAMSDTNQRVVQAARALLDFMYLAHLGSITDDDLEAMEDALRTFHDHKDVFEELGAVATDKGFHGIPKIHMISHYMHLICELGTPDGYNTETSERLHIDFAKMGYRASNKVNATKQMALYIQRLEAIEMHGAYLEEIAGTMQGVQDQRSDAESARSQGEIHLDDGMRGNNEFEDDDWDAWYDEEDEEDEDQQQELLDAGVRMMPLMGFEELRWRGQHEGKPWEVKEALGADVNENRRTFYPNPQHVLAKTPTRTATASFIVREHGANRFLHAVHSFLAKEVPQHNEVTFYNDSTFNIWSRARLFHSPPPFQPSEESQMDVVRAQPAKIDQYERISRPRRFDTVLLLAYPDRTGIHRYRPGRVRVIFELPFPIHSACPEPLVYVDLFNSPSAGPVRHLGLFTTTRSLVQQQRASFILHHPPPFLSSDMNLGMYDPAEYNKILAKAGVHRHTDNDSSNRKSCKSHCRWGQHTRPLDSTHPEPPNYDIAPPRRKQGSMKNSNNVCTELSPLTSVIERDVGLQLCQMLGYDISNTESSKPWAHIVRENMKFYPLSVACAMEPGASLDFICDEFMIELCTGETKLFSQATAWELLNLKPETVFDIPERLQNEYAISSGALSAVLNPYLIQTCGKDVLEKKFDIKPSKYFVGTTKHGSWPNGAGNILQLSPVSAPEHILDVPVDINAHMDISKLDQQLDQCLITPVFAVVASSSGQNQALGLSFAAHTNAARGGYYASLLHEPEVPQPNESIVPEQALSNFTRSQLEHLRFADSITIDPHKSAGYIPYPAGGLCYHDGRMRYLVTWTNPNVYKDSDATESMGVHGIEGSEPGASAVGAWLSHRIIGLHKHGYGSLLGESLFSCTKIYTH
ncbi:DNA annealing helicase and endonuclease ZRANB3 [Rhizoctonia solani]|uniref:DNA annealing helicase and endonuclease ZRANB3 n=1 Tax=Rhizoctonia solani TaxID=456999 RepID=A0A0K6GA94_9AGAM|nr:DNA annealing helicase and endonuclease ZRANB3 [Rhizoctonia solani]